MLLSPLSLFQEELAKQAKAKQELLQLPLSDWPVDGLQQWVANVLPAKWAAVVSAAVGECEVTGKEFAHYGPEETQELCGGSKMAASRLMKRKNSLLVSQQNQGGETGGGEEEEKDEAGPPLGGGGGAAAGGGGVSGGLAVVNKLHHNDHGVSCVCVSVYLCVYLSVCVCAYVCS